MSETEHTTVAVQRFLNDLAGVDGASPADPIIRGLMERSVHRLHLLCVTMLYRSYPRLTRPPLNLKSEEMLGGVVERLLKALRGARPQNVRQFFALANQHMRWELNDLARRLDEHPNPLELREDLAPAQESSGSQLSPDTRRMLEAIEALPDDEREVFSLVRIQGMNQTEAADILGVSTKTVQRRLNRGLMLLSQGLGDLRPAQAAGPEL